VQPAAQTLEAVAEENALRPQQGPQTPERRHHGRAMAKRAMKSSNNPHGASPGALQCALLSTPSFPTPLVRATRSEVGCILVFNGVSAERDHNQADRLRDATAHSEMLVSAYSQVKPSEPRKITAIVSHYNASRHECVAEISSVRHENGGQSYYEVI
jgi:hypothetical protein